MNSKEIGGSNRIVQIHESKFYKRKYSIGRAVETFWAVGSVDIESCDSFFVEVLKRDSETFSQIILKHEKIGSTLYTNCWRGYNNLSTLGYKHFTVYHSENFVNPANLIHAQHIEGTWNVFEKKFRAEYISSNSNLTLYFAEFGFKSK
ncbi:hypothetical protein H311_00461 [Anncaliia algerae PRA109]|nr:hypothetical protein H311_00461 [Anncaliia algerae PRA109]